VALTLIDGGPPLTLLQVKNYVLSLFPFIQWLPRYNLTWLTGDLIA
jgi:hypothetical protein